MEFYPLVVKTPSGGRPPIEYFVLVSMAKGLLLIALYAMWYD